MIEFEQVTLDEMMHEDIIGTRMRLNSSGLEITVAKDLKAAYRRGLEDGYDLACMELTDDDPGTDYEEVKEAYDGIPCSVDCGWL